MNYCAVKCGNAVMHRRHSWCSEEFLFLKREQKPRRRVKTAADAVKFIDAAGFCLLFPIKNVALPSLYFALTGRVPIQWDVAVDKLWKWKDHLPRQRRAFYSKYFKKRGTFISLETLPYFLAMEGMSLEPRASAGLYAAGRITDDARTICEALENHGTLATLELRHICKMETVAGNKRYKRAMLELSRDLIFVHSGTEKETGAWASSRFELTVRAFPKEAAAARRISPEAARVALARLFGWTKAEAVEAMR